MARLVVPELLHQFTQPSNRRGQGEEADYAPLRRIGWPVGDMDWLNMLEEQTGQVLMA